MQRMFADLVLSRHGGSGGRGRYAMTASLILHSAALTLLVLVSIITRDTLPPVDALPGPMPAFVRLPPQGESGAHARPVRAPRPPRPAAPAALSSAPELPPPLASDDVLDTLDGPPDAIVLLPCAHECEPDRGHGGVPGGDPTALVPGGGPPSAPAAPIRPGGDIRPPVKVRHVLPAYPEIARVAGVQGFVVLDCTIGGDGRVSDVKVLGGPLLLQTAAADAVRQWLYRPTLLNGVAVPIVMTVTVRFTLGR